MKLINLPCKDNDITDIKTGDIIYISGLLVTGRDKIYQRITQDILYPNDHSQFTAHNVSTAKDDNNPPIDLNGMAIYHAGPIVRENNLIPVNSEQPPRPFAVPLIQNKWELISIGPTTSARMEKWSADFIKKTGVKIIIGKGGMGENTTLACREYKAIHCVYTGGCAVLGASQIEKIEGCYFPEFGMAECMWVMRTSKFGPLIVNIDTYGNNLYAENNSHYQKIKTTVLENIFT